MSRARAMEKRRYLALMPLLLLFGCSRGGAAGGAKNPQAGEPVYRPQFLYQKYCAPCHDAANLQLFDEPPPLDGLFRKKTFPSGAPATDEELRDVILHGRGTMPAFEGTFSGEDLDALTGYLHTR